MKRLQWALTFMTAIGGAAILYAQNPVSIAQLGTTAVSTNSGTKDGGTQRVVIATDQPQLTNKLLVTPDANSAVNVGQLAGTTTDTNSGNKSAGTLRVVLATDQPALTNKFLVTPDANSAINLAQVGGSSISQTNPVPIVFPGTLVSGAVTSAMTGTTSTSVVSGTASNYLYIQTCTASNGSTTVSTDILLQDGSGGTTLWVIPAPAATVASTGGGGATITFAPALKVPTSGNALYAANVTTSSSTKISCSGFRSTTSY